MKTGPAPPTSTEPSPISHVEAPPESGLCIVWVSPLLEGKVTELAGRRVLMGRDLECHACLPGAEMSRHHAEAVPASVGWVLRDLGSTNGVFVNGVQVSERKIEEGSIVRVGVWVGVVLKRLRPPQATPLFREVAEGLYVGPVLGPLLEGACKTAATDLPVLVQGETGTGKERVARAVHQWSGRGGPFVALNCAALPESLVEAELFGYRKGAFTGATHTSLGHFRAAKGGTLLLDEVTDLPLAQQAKLLRALEQREVIPLGESSPVAVDVRIVAASQSDLREAVQAKRFRADLLGRLEGIVIRLPPLRERTVEVPYLFARLLQKYATERPPAFGPRVVEWLCLHKWPFNVRELDLLVRRLLVLHGTEPMIRLHHLPKDESAGPPQTEVDKEKPSARPRPSNVHDEDRDQRDFEALLQGLRAQGGNVAKAASAAGFSRQRAYRLLADHPEVDLEAWRSGREK